jgi:hypothetical protein
MEYWRNENNKLLTEHSDKNALRAEPRHKAYGQAFPDKVVTL